ncbi:MAG: MATE family efflux transporter, partial [Vallitaleaceae bacterium]|nr:MATE family efflux transporter [Vallitaleaceae bacterium]
MTNQVNINEIQSYKRGYFKKMMVLGLPIIIQNLVSTSLNMVDTIMISGQGEQSLAAVAFANKFLFILFVILFGIYSGTSIFISQFYGAGDHKRIHHVLGIGITLGIGVSSIFFLLAMFVPHMVMRVFIDSPEVIAYGSSYLRIVSLSYLPMGVTFALSNASRNVHLTKIPMFSSIIALLLNTGINYLLIAGNLGFPELGVKGAAIATVISRLVEFSILFSFIFIKKGNPLRASLHELFGFSKELFAKILKTIAPVIVNEGLWVVGTSVYYIAYGKLGEDSVAAMQVAMTLTDFCWAIFTGLGSAAAILVGNAVGNDENERALSYAKITLRFGVVIAILIGGLMILLRPFLNILFPLEAETLEWAKASVLVMALYFPVRNFNYIMFISVLRSGGDT